MRSKLKVAELTLSLPSFLANRMGDELVELWEKTKKGSTLQDLIGVCVSPRPVLNAEERDLLYNARKRIGDLNSLLYREASDTSEELKTKVRSINEAYLSGALSLREARRALDKVSSEAVAFRKEASEDPDNADNFAVLAELELDLARTIRAIYPNPFKCLLEGRRK